MDPRPEGPGAVLAVLCRGRTSTDVRLVLDAGETAGLPWAAAREEGSQWDLAEELVRATGLEGVDRLYASTLSIRHAGRNLGIFVAFVAAGETPPSADSSEWMDLRTAEQELAPVWSDALTRVRERFVARPPDEALRLR